MGRGTNFFSTKGLDQIFLTKRVEGRVRSGGMEEDGGAGVVAEATEELGGADGEGEASWGTNGGIRVGGSEGGRTSG